MAKSKAKKEEKVLNKTLIFFIRVLKEEGFISTWSEAAKIYFAIEGEEITPNKLAMRAKSALASDGVETNLFFEYCSLKSKLKKLIEVTKEKEEIKEETEVAETKLKVLANDATAVSFSIKFEDLEPVFGVDLENDPIDTIRYKINQKINDDKFLLEYIGLDPYINTIESRKFGSWTTVVKEKDSMGIEQARLIANQKFEIVIKKKKNIVGYPTREDFVKFLEDFLKERGITPFDLFENNYKTFKSEEHPVLNENLIMVSPGLELHLGKLGSLADFEDYSTKQAMWRIKKVTEEIVKYQLMVGAAQFTMGIGNDFFNSDTVDDKTTAGTPQNNDSRYKETYLWGKVGMVSMIETLKMFFNKIVLKHNPGNHDEKSSFSLFSHIYDIYSMTEDPKVSVPFTFEDIRFTTIQEFGDNLLVFSHGNSPGTKNLNDADLAKAVKYQYPEQYNKAKNVYVFAGHLHTDRENKYDKVTVIRTASLSGIENWHAANAYIGQRQGHSVYLFDKERGYVGKHVITLTEKDKLAKISSMPRNNKIDINKGMKKALDLNAESSKTMLLAKKIKEINEHLKATHEDFNDRLKEILVILGIKNITEEQVREIINIMGYEEKTKPARLELKYIEKATTK